MKNQAVHPSSAKNNVAVQLVLPFAETSAVPHVFAPPAPGEICACCGRKVGPLAAPPVRVAAANARRARSMRIGLVCFLCGRLVLPSAAPWVAARVAKWLAARRLV